MAERRPTICVRGPGNTG